MTMRYFVVALLIVIPSSAWARWQTPRLKERRAGLTGKPS